MSVVKFRPLGDNKMKFEKNCCSRPEKPKLEKGWFGSKQSNSTLWVGQTQRVPKPFGLSPSHFSELSKLWYLIWKRGVWAICWFKNLEFFPTDRYFLNIFLSRPGVYQWSSIFWDATQLFPIAERAIIPHLKEDSQYFHMTPVAWIFLVK